MRTAAKATGTMAVALLLTLTACSSDPSADPTTSPVAQTPTETPTPTESTPEPVTAPTRAFDGSCDDLLGAVDLAGTPLEGAVVVTSAASPGAAGAATAGGTVCTFANDTYSVLVSAFPTDVVSAEIAAAWSETSCDTVDFETVACGRAVDLGGTWVLASVLGAESGPVVPDDELVTAADAVAEPIALAFEGTATPVAATPTDQWWDATCASLLTDADIPGILGADAAALQEGYPGGAGESAGTGTANEIATAHGTATLCQWYADESGELTAIRVWLLPGSAWAWDDLSGPAEGAQDPIEEVTIDGADAAFRTGSTTYASDGTNVLVADVMVADADTAVAQVLAALNG